MDVAAKLSVALPASQFLATAIHNGASEFKFRDSVVLDYGSVRRSLLAFVPDTGLEASSPKIILHLVRHAQGPHNIVSRGAGFLMEDPGLTDFGMLQSATLGGNFQRMDKVTHIITSPCRRTIMTAKYAFRPLLNRGMEIHLFNFLKERGNNPCNNGSPVDVLRTQFKDLKLNADALEPNWQNQFLTYNSRTNWRKAALTMRKELYLIGKSFLEKGEVNEDGNVEMVVVSHGGTLRTIDGTRDDKDADHWANTEHRAYHFFVKSRAEAYGVAPWQGLREFLLHEEFKTTKVIEKPLRVRDLEDLGWRNADMDRISKWRTTSLFEYQKLNSDRRRLKNLLSPSRIR